MEPVKPKEQTLASAGDMLFRRYIEGDRALEVLLAQEEETLMIAEKIYALRTAAGLTQRELAARIGTTASVISRLERADYNGHSLTMLQRIARALDCRLALFFIRLTEQGKTL